MSKWKNKFNWQEIKGDIEKQRQTTKKSWNDDRFWRPDWKAAVEKERFFKLRFLPDQEGNPFVKYYTHHFKYLNSEGNGTKWYINNCISTFGWDPACPICDKNSEYWESAYDSDKEIAKERGRRVNFVSNVLIIDDPINPDNNGKVFLYSYGVKIFGKIEKMMFPSEADLADEDFRPFIPFDLEEGASFKLKIVMQGDYPNYDTSEWSPQGPVTKDDDELDKIMEQVHSLEEFIDPTKYPSIEDTLKQVGHLLGAPVATDNEEEEESSAPKSDNPFLKGDDEEEAEKPEPEKEKEEKPKPKTPPKKVEKKEEPKPEPEPESQDDPDSGGDDDEDFFKNLK